MIPLLQLACALPSPGTEPALESTALPPVLTAWAAPGVSLDTISRDVTAAAALRGRLSADGGQVWWVVAPSLA